MNCSICLPVYNVEVYLQCIFLNLLRLKILFNKITIIFGYDHSGDKSLELLQKFKSENSNSNFNIEILINNNTRSKFRTYNLAYIRNLMINYVFENCSNYEYFIMMDSDDVCVNEIKIDILQKHLLNGGWDSLSFNRTYYYDIWALLYDNIYHNCRSFGCNSKFLVDYIRSDIQNKLQNLQAEYLQVYSAFNGFAIYKLEKFKNCKYDGEYKYLFDDEKINTMLNYLYIVKKKENIYRKKLQICGIRENCEHTNFHIEAINKNNAKIFIAKDNLFF